MNVLPAAWYSRLPNSQVRIRPPATMKLPFQRALEDLDNQVLSDPASGFLSPNSHSYASVSP